MRTYGRNKGEFTIIIFDLNYDLIMDILSTFMCPFMLK